MYGSMYKAKETPLLIPDSNKPRVVVIGAGFGGLELVKNLSGDDFQIVMFDKHNYHTFQPLLYQVATAGLETESIAATVRDIFGDKKNFYFRMAEVTAINSKDKYVDTAIGHLPYDYLVIATGAVTNYFGNKEIEANAYPMKKIPQALELRSKILQNFEDALLVNHKEAKNSLLDIVIVGGGPTGVELAGAIAELRKYVLPRDFPEIDFKEMDIHLIEGTEQLLGGMSKEASDHALKYLHNFGVEVHLNKLVSGYDGYRARLNDGTELISQTLIWAAGVKGNPLEGINAENIIKGPDRIKVNAYNAIEGANDVYAIGDVAAMITKDTPKGHPMLAPVAVQQGMHLAKNLKNLINKKPCTPFRYHNKGVMATIGRNRAVADLPLMKVQGFFAWLLWMFIHVYTLIGSQNRFMVLMNWIWSYITFNKGARIITNPKLKNRRNENKTFFFEKKEKNDKNEQKPAYRETGQHE